MLALAAAACSGTSASRAPSPGGTGADDLVAHRGTFHERFLLTGELRAVRSDDIVVPRTPSWEIPIRWMETDGARVEAGQKVLEFDNSSFAGSLEEKRLSETQAANDLLREDAAASATEDEAKFEVEQRRTALEKARIDASIPPELRSAREHQEKQLALRRAEMEYEKAVDTLEAQRKGTKEDLDVRRIQLAKARREIATAEQAIEALMLMAPRAGILVVGEHPWEGRKLQVGDSVWVGLPVMSIPDLTEMKVAAILSDVDDGRVVSGMSAVCTLDTYPELPFPATVVEVTPIAQEIGRRSQRRGFQVSVRLERSDPERMRPGMSVKVEVDARTIENALLVPRAALDLRADPPRALLEGGGEAAVRLGPCGAVLCVVEEGLADGARLRRRT